MLKSKNQWAICCNKSIGLNFFHLYIPALHIFCLDETNNAKGNRY